MFAADAIGGRNLEKAKKVAGTIDRVQLSLHVPDVEADLRIATGLALRELHSLANFNDVVHFTSVSDCMYKNRANKSDLSGPRKPD